MARPLRKYIRPGRIEKSIDAALAQDSATLGARARITAPAHPDFLPRECLVHLIREAIHRQDSRTVTPLMQALLKRCEANLLKTVPNNRMRNAEAIREQILSSFGLMFAEDGTTGHEDGLDYFECSFGRAFRSLRIDHVRREISDRAELVDLPEALDEEGELAFDDEALGRLSVMARIDGGQEARTDLPLVLKAVNDLPHNEKRAVVLCRILGYQDESTDPTVRTAATICNVKGRTIRYRLSRADERLKKLKEGP
jgi:DNA-directed RNA polymerase specialized sigma24 family protein